MGALAHVGRGLAAAGCPLGMEDEVGMRWGWWKWHSFVSAS